MKGAASEFQLRIGLTPLFERVPLIQALTMVPDATPEDEAANQLSLFEL
jgi:hypothetical protein